MAPAAHLFHVLTATTTCAVPRRRRTLQPELGHRLDVAFAANEQRRALVQFGWLDIENAAATIVGQATACSTIKASGFASYNRRSLPRGDFEFADTRTTTVQEIARKVGHHGSDVAHIQRCPGTVHATIRRMSARSARANSVLRVVHGQIAPVFRTLDVRMCQKEFDRLTDRGEREQPCPVVTTIIRCCCRR